MKSDGEIMKILAAYDLTGSQRTAAELVGCSHHTVAAHVAARDAGRAVGTPARRPRNIDAFLDKIEEWVEASKGKIRADIAHEKDDVPIEVRDAIAEHARRQGQSVQAYLLRLIEREARVLQNAAAFERTSALRITIPPGADPVDIIREGRDLGFEADRSDSP